MYRKNVAGQFFCFQGVDSTTGGIKSGVTWTVRRCLDGTFGAGGGTVTEDGTTGWYKYAMAQADSNANDTSFNFTGTGAVPQTVNIITTACDPTTATNFGITGIPAVASGSAGALLIDGTGTAAISNSSGKVLLQAAQKVDVDTIKTNPVVNAGTVTFPTNATLASTVNITAGAIDTVTNLTNLPSIPANWITATGITAAALNGKGDWLLSSGYTAPLSAAGTRSAVGMASANLDTQLAALDVDILTRLASSSYTAPDNTSIATILGQTGTTGVVLTAGYGAAGALNINVKTINGTTIIGNGSTVPFNV